MITPAETLDQERHDLERALLTTIHEFEERTGLSVSSVFVNRVPNANPDRGDELADVSVSVTIPRHPHYQ